MVIMLDLKDNLAVKPCAMSKQSSTDGLSDYVGGIQYKSNGTIDFIQTEEGIARNNGANYSYEYSMEDHSDNVRATFYEKPKHRAIRDLAT